MSTGLKSHESGTEGEDESGSDFNDIFGNDEDERSGGKKTRLRSVFELETAAKQN